MLGVGCEGLWVGGVLRRFLAGGLGFVFLVMGWGVACKEVIGRVSRKEGRTTSLVGGLLDEGAEPGYLSVSFWGVRRKRSRRGKVGWTGFKWTRLRTAASTR